MPTLVHSYELVDQKGKTLGTKEYKRETLSIPEIAKELLSMNYKKYRPFTYIYRDPGMEMTDGTIRYRLAQLDKASEREKEQLDNLMKQGKRRADVFVVLGKPYNTDEEEPIARFPTGYEDQEFLFRYEYKPVNDSISDEDLRKIIKKIEKIVSEKYGETVRITAFEGGIDTGIGYPNDPRGSWDLVSAFLAHEPQENVTSKIHGFNIVYPDELIESKNEQKSQSALEEDTQQIGIPVEWVLAKL